MSKRQSSRVRCATRLRGAAEEAGASAMLVSLDSRKPRPAQSKAQRHAMDGIWESRKGCGESWEGAMAEKYQKVLRVVVAPRGWLQL
jgi:hypothetical protein